MTWKFKWATYQPNTTWTKARWIYDSFNEVGLSCRMYCIIAEYQVASTAACVNVNFSWATQLMDVWYDHLEFNNIVRSDMLGYVTKKLFTPLTFLEEIDDDDHASSQAIAIVSCRRFDCFFSMNWIINWSFKLMKFALWVLQRWTTYIHICSLRRLCQQLGFHRYFL